MTAGRASRLLLLCVFVSYLLSRHITKGTNPTSQ
jgi:hypothetical protein